MKVVVSIRQRSFARFVAFDLAEAARRLGWAVHWIDFDTLTQQLAGAPPHVWQDALTRVTEQLRTFAADVVFSYGIEATLPPFPEVLPHDPWRLAAAARCKARWWRRWACRRASRNHRRSTRPALVRLRRVATDRAAGPREMAAGWPRCRN